MKRRALLVALSMAVVGALLLVLYMRKFETEMSGGERIPLLVAVKPIERGSILTEDMLAERLVPMAYVEDRAIRAIDRNKIVGLALATPVQTQETVMWTDLAITTEESALSSLVQPGKRAFTVRTAVAGDTQGNALIRPGDYVDVIVTLNDDQSPEGRRAVVLLQRIIVLAVGYDTKADAATGDARKSSSMGSEDKVLTLSLSLQESQLLALALEKGRLSVAVRNLADQRITSEVPDLKTSALVDTHSRRAVTAPVRGAGPIKLESPGQQ
ncbi:MAG: Flp pilus assembly protein CpaB [Polyangiaceae bacterium]